MSSQRLVFVAEAIVGMWECSLQTVNDLSSAVYHRLHKTPQSDGPKACTQVGQRTMARFQWPRHSKQVDSQAIELRSCQAIVSFFQLHLNQSKLADH